MRAPSTAMSDLDGADSASSCGAIAPMPRAVQDPDSASSCGVGCEIAAGTTEMGFIDELQAKPNSLRGMYASAQNTLIEGLQWRRAGVFSELRATP